jgi:hypothetical protein
MLDIYTDTSYISIVVFVSFIHCAYVHYNSKPKARGEKAFCGWWYKSPVGSVRSLLRFVQKLKFRKGGYNNERKAIGFEKHHLIV